MKIEEKLAKQSIKRLDISDTIIETLKENNINTLENLCEKSITYLKNINISQSEINKINLELQLIGLGLRESI